MKYFRSVLISLMTEKNKRDLYDYAKAVVVIGVSMIATMIVLHALL